MQKAVVVDPSLAPECSEHDHREHLASRIVENCNTIVATSPWCSPAFDVAGMRAVDQSIIFREGSNEGPFVALAMWFAANATFYGTLTSATACFVGFPSIAQEVTSFLT